MKNNLEAILNPRSIAVIGASDTKPKIGWEVFNNLLRYGFTGKLYPINKDKPEILGYKAYKSILDVEEDIDCAVIVVPKIFVCAEIEKCGQKKVKGAVIITAGFKETGKAGAEMEKQFCETARKYGVTIIGPNCLGVVNTNPAVRLNAAFAPTLPQATGVIGFASQSGALCSGILNVIPSLNVGVRQLVSLGNQADISGNEFMEYWKDADEIQQVLLYLESMQKPAEFIKQARSLSAKKPLIVLKSGKSKEGGKAASSHTGSMSSADSDVQAVLDSCGAIREDGIQAVFNTATIFEKCPLPNGKRVGIVTNTGGLGVMATDMLVAEGLELAALDSKTETALKYGTPEEILWAEEQAKVTGKTPSEIIKTLVLPAEASSSNPVDTIAAAPMNQYKRAVEMVLNDNNVDIVLVLYIYLLSPNERNDLVIMQNLNALKKKYAETPVIKDKPIIAALMTLEDLKGLVNAKIENNAIPYFNYIEPAVWGAKRLWERRAYLNNLKKPKLKVSIDKKQVEKTRQIIDAAKPRLSVLKEEERMLTTFESLEVFAGYGLPCPEYALVKSESDLDKWADKHGFPENGTVLKISGFSEYYNHKTENKGVVLGIKDKTQLHAKYREMIERIENDGQKSWLEGIVVMQQVGKCDREFIMGAKAFDDTHLLMFGIGGILAEAMNEVNFVSLPLDAHGIEKLVSGKPIQSLLGVFRKKNKAISREELGKLFYTIDRFIADFPEVAGMDLNPIMANEEGKLFAVDARVQLK